MCRASSSWEPVEERTDIYSLGIVALETITGKLH